MEFENEWEWPYTDGYTGMFYSDGKFQASVANGAYEPRSKLAALSRKHDTAYAECDVDSCLDLADNAYYDSTRSMSFVPRSIGALPRMVMPKLRALGWGKAKNKGEMAMGIGSALADAYLRGSQKKTENPKSQSVLDISSLDNYRKYSSRNSPQVYEPSDLPEIGTDTVYNPNPKEVKDRFLPTDVCSFPISEEKPLNEFSRRKRNLFGGPWNPLYMRKKKRNKNKIYVY